MRDTFMPRRDVKVVIEREDVTALLSVLRGWMMKPDHPVVHEHAVQRAIWALEDSL